MDPTSETTPSSTTPLPQPTQGAFVPADQPAQAPTPVGTPPADEPDDSLDQEWVSKAKEIVERTKNDPFQATKELSKVKADYLKARYNKDSKVAEDTT